MCMQHDDGTGRRGVIIQYLNNYLVSKRFPAVNLPYTCVDHQHPLSSQLMHDVYSHHSNASTPGQIAGRLDDAMMLKTYGSDTNQGALIYLSWQGFVEADVLEPWSGIG